MKLDVLDDAVGWTRNHPERWFPNGRVDAISLVNRVTADVLVLGGGECRIAQRESWWIVASDVDWLGNANDPARRGATPSIDELFTRLVATPEHGEHTNRAEVVINAFATDIAVWQPTGARAIKGAQFSAWPIWPECRRALAFHIA